MFPMYGPLVLKPVHVSLMIMDSFFSVWVVSIALALPLLEFYEAGPAQRLLFYSFIVSRYYTAAFSYLPLSVAPGPAPCGDLPVSLTCGVCTHIYICSM